MFTLREGGGGGETFATEIGLAALAKFAFTTL